jgi:APA family basic amino acid/polyamine antiporter
MGTDGLMPGAAGFVDQRGTPSVGLLLSTIVALALLGTGTFESIATVFAFFAITSYVGAFVSLLVIRRREPDLPRPFRSWGYPWTTVVVLAGACSLLAGLVAGAPRQSLIAIAALAASYPVFRLTRVRSVRL